MINSTKINQIKYDCVIIGGGPAGLVAATYLARARRNVIVIDAGNSRASMIPISHNCPGFCEGISGSQLLNRLRNQAERYGVSMVKEFVTHITGSDSNFITECNGFKISSSKIIVATGVVDISYALPNIENAIKKGLIRYCPICDGYEALNKKIAVIGEGEHGLKECLFLRTFSKDITLYSDKKFVSYDCEEAKINLITDNIKEITIDDSKCNITTSSGRIIFDIIYIALGVKPRTELITKIKAESDESGCIIVDRYQETSIKGIFAIGDIVLGLSQLSVAYGQAAIAAIRVHNQLPRNFI